MPAIGKIFYSPRTFDLVFAGAGLLAVFGLVSLAGKPFPAIEAPDSPLLKGVIVLAVVIAGGAMSLVTTRVDQKCADDFVFSTLTKSAFQGFMGYILASTLWEVLFSHSIGAISTPISMMIAMGSWSLAYLLTRWKGTRA
ncbi:hypothetical protein GRI89_08870 [Altererythrobacter salegens]|uniref:Uncharacterized protein n=1 Tax=Croceibacterium salegens TaxID=1737568 RepID=A0A6I4SUR0_9SPHN|nr:hypothetical protein [Croceibacterium salegens]MXO59651.1 hypothetical protein [Croceibacterium salegens]